jgi:hypothetical protein
MVRGGGHTRLWERGWGSPNSDEGTYAVVFYLYVYKYFVEPYSWKFLTTNTDYCCWPRTIEFTDCLLACLPFSDVDSARIGGHIAAGIGVATIAAGVAVASVAAIATISTTISTAVTTVAPAVTSVAPAVASVAVASVIGVSYGQWQKAEQDLKNQKKVISRLSRNSSRRET